MRRLCIALLAAWGLAVGRAPNIADAAAATADATAAATADATAAATGDADLVRLADDRLQLGLDRVHGALRELIQLPDGTNQLDAGPAAWSLWQVSLRSGQTTQVISAAEAGTPQLEPLDGPSPGLRAVWQPALPDRNESLRVVVSVRLDTRDAALSRWELSVTKPRDVSLVQVRFPRVACLQPRGDEVLAVPRELGALARNPRSLTRGKDNRGARLAWRYPWVMAMQCLALYQPDGPGFYAACDDSQGFRNEFALWGDAEDKLHFEILHEPEREARDMAEFQLPFVAVLGAFRGDWTTAAQLYRQSAGATTIAQRGRLGRQLTPDWLCETGLWIWNRGRSPGVLGPARMMQQHLQTPVGVLWHWWHNCAYDTGFPEFLPPREGAEPFQTALAAARQQDVRAILYMNQRLWGTQTESWSAEGAERYAVKGSDGKIRPEVYNVYTKAPCAPMCIGTRFWRDKYASLAEQVFCHLQADGIYMDQTGVLANCYDPTHGHILGPGRYWTEGLATLTDEIRDRCAARGRVALGGEFCGEPWIGNLDLTLALSVSADRIGLGQPWEPIPFFQAVYHGSTIVFGNYASLTHPPYDEKWPPDQAPPTALSLLDPKFSSQFLLEQARTFVWGMQPMLANFLPDQVQQRANEIDFVTRLVRTRSRALKYLLYGTWQRPPRLDVPQREIDVAQVGVYTPLKATRRTYPVALAGAWRAADGDVAIALASVSDARLDLQLPIDVRQYDLAAPCDVFLIDHAGRQRLGAFDSSTSSWRIELAPRGLCILEFCQPDKS